MSLVILPTFEILTENMTFDPLYRLFIPGGVKTVVRDSVVLTSFKERGAAHDYYQSLQCHRNALVDYVLKRFDEYTQKKVQLMYDEEGGDVRREALNLSEYMSHAGELELITQEIDHLVRLMMEDLFRTRPYNILEEGSYWKGRDLFVQVESFPFGGFGRGI